MNKPLPEDDIVGTLKDVRPGARAPLLVLDRLERFLDEHGIGVGPIEALPIGDGHSLETYLLRRGSTEVVLRRPPRPPFAPGVHDVLREVKILRALGTASVRTPSLLAWDEHGTVLGVPCAITEFIPGVIVATELPTALDSPHERRLIGEELVDALVELHACDYGACGLGELGRHDGFLARRMLRYLNAARADPVRPLAGIGWTAELLSESLPSEQPPGIVHGDYRLGNVMYRPQSPARLLAILDWETATIGDPLSDLGFMLATYPERGEPDDVMVRLHSAARRDGFPTRTDLAERYAAGTGRSIADLQWYMAFALWRVAIQLEGLYRRYVRGQSSDPFHASLEDGVPELLTRAARLASERAAARRSPGSPQHTSGPPAAVAPKEKRLSRPEQKALSFPDPLIACDTPDPPAFDRFYFNLYGDEREAGFAVIGAGVYPAASVVDGFVCFVVEGDQRNLRLSDHMHGAQTQVGPLTWEVVEPMRTWHLGLAPNPSGIELDLTWHAHAPAHEIGDYEVIDSAGGSSHAHYFQAGRYGGVIAIDGREVAVAGWHGQRDRSRGQRRVRDSLGMHQWVQIQFDDESIGFLFNEDRQGNVAHCDGAVMCHDGTVVPITAVRHDLEIAPDLEIQNGRLLVSVADGSAREITFSTSGRGIYMTGGGYGGLHGTDRGLGHIAVERWPLDGSRNPKNLDLGITDALCEFREGPRVGLGIFEYAFSRSSSYRYRPTLER